MEKKEEVRSHFKRMRRELPAEEVTFLSAQICDHLLSVEEIRQAGAVLLYAAVRGEPDLQPFARSKTFALPRVCGDEMDFYEVSSATDLVPGAFGIPEPPPDAKKLLPMPADAVILVPGVAFMEDGNRIGMGKGYYDRFLTRYPDLLRIGIAYEKQMGAVWEPEEQDLPVDLIVTEHRVIRCRTTHQG